DAEIQERRFVAAGLDHRRYRDDGQRGPGAESRRRQSCGKSAPIRKPLQGVADARPVYRPGPETTYRRRDVQEHERIRIGIHRPGDAAKNASDQNDEPWAEAVD